MIAMAQHEPPQVDLDALQAQINLSMSLTENLVSSWIRPIAKNLAKPSPSSKNPEKELQEYLRRPPRLGVGAPLPESSGVLERENIKLKNKLSSNDKKRRRGDAEGKVENPTEDIEENERKGESSVKKARLDPFSKPGKKKNKEDLSSLSKPKGMDLLDVVAGVQSSRATSETSYSGNTSIVDRIGSNHNEISVSEQTEETSVPTTSTSRKRKRKKKAAIVNPVEEAGGSNTTSTGTSHHEGKSETQDDPEWEGSDEEWAGFGDTIIIGPPTMEEKPKQIDNLTSENVPDISPTTNPALSLLSYPRAIPVPPLLNLHGPPLSDTEDTASLSQTGLSPTSKKKRRRNKNKNKKSRNANNQPSVS